MIKSVLMFGGTFDPVHCGHVSFLQNASNLVCADKTLIIPCSIPPHKANAATDGALRAQMSSVLCNFAKNAEVFDYEILRGGKSFTVDTVLQVEKLYANAKIYLCTGSDMLLYFRKWHMWQELIKKVTIVVQNRADKDSLAVLNEAKILTSYGANIILANAQPIEVSSTQIRQMISENISIENLVPKEVYNIIINNNLYGVNK